MYTGAFSSYKGNLGWQVLFMSGVRLQTMGGTTTASYIAGVLPPLSYMANDNFLFTSWPYLGGGTSCYGGAGAWNTCSNNGTAPGGGISFTLRGNITTVTGASTSVLNINGDPVSEYPLHNQDGNGGYTPGSTIIGPSFFMYQLVTDANPLNCVPPAAGSASYASTLYSFQYASTPNTQSVVANPSTLFSSCASGTWQLLGPFNVPSGPGTTTPQYALVAASGTRTFALGTTSQTVNITGIDGEDGGDYRVYASGIPVDDAGITFTTNKVGYFYSGSSASPIDTTSGDYYINRQSTPSRVVLRSGAQLCLHH